MVLNGNTIKSLIADDMLIINGDPENVHASSYDVTLSDTVLVFKKAKKPIELINANAIENMYKEVDIKKGFLFKPGETILACLDEQFNMPDDICGSIRGRTSYNRLGIIINVQHLNPGFMGKINLTICNNSKTTYILTPKLHIAQAVFEKMDYKVPNELLYGNPYNNTYQNDDGHQGSKVYEDYIGKVVRHFKGNYYFIEDVSMDSETKDWVIVYRTLYQRKDSNKWTRSAKMFFEEIDGNRPDNITGQKHRFEIVDDLTIDHTKKKPKK